MHKLLFIVLACASFALAQLGLNHTAQGLRAPTAKTLGQGFLYVSGSYEMVSDGNSLAMEGYYMSNGEKTDVGKNTPSNDESLFLAFGVLDNFDLGLTVPFHYDGDINSDVNGLGFGDLMLHAKGAFFDAEWMQLGLGGEIIFPTGSTEKGFRPRHRWFFGAGDSAYAYTADSWSAGVNAYISASYKEYLAFNGYVGLLKTYSDKETYILWGGGFNVFPERLLTFILEISGESVIRSTRVAKNFLNSPFRFTPGIRLHLPYETYLTISGDIGLNYFRTKSESNGLPVHLNNGNLDYLMSGSPSIAMGISLSKMFDFSWDDSDDDGVIDRKDMCPGTGRNQVVNARGCPVDEDQDGVLNIVDMCLGTPANVKVGMDGCPLDRDGDGVYDYLDHCPNTNKGFAVDSVGCMRDSDGDGIDDNHDLCVSTNVEDPVDSTGCPLDADRDGVINDVDLCPNTPEDVSIDLMGCPLDDDHDGVPNEYDLCPESHEKEIANEKGCPKDSDLDGVPDSKDSCAETPEGMAVDSLGCRVDHDHDGVFDEDDECPDTPLDAPTDSLGCAIDSDGDGVADWKDACPGTLARMVVDEGGCPVNARMNFNAMAQRIRFRPGDTTLVHSSYTALSDVIAAMREYPMVLEIQCSGADAPNRADELSEARAQSIYNFLEMKGIAADRLIYKGYGKRLPPTQTQKSGSSALIRLIPMQMKPE